METEKEAVGDVDGATFGVSDGVSDGASVVVQKNNLCASA